MASGISPAVIFDSGIQKSSSSPGRRLVIRVFRPLSWIVAPGRGLKLKVVFMAPLGPSRFTVVRSELFRNTRA